MIQETLRNRADNQLVLYLNAAYHYSYFFADRSIQQSSNQLFAERRLIQHSSNRCTYFNRISLQATIQNMSIKSVVIILVTGCVMMGASTAKVLHQQASWWLCRCIQGYGGDFANRGLRTNPDERDYLSWQRCDFIRGCGEDFANPET